MSIVPCLIGILWGAVSTGPAEPPRAAPRVERREFGKLADGTPVDAYRITNGRGLEAQVMTLGATLISLKAPDRHGRIGEVTLCRASYEEYAQGHPLLGSVVGRYANRIAGARFLLDGVEYALERNAGKNHIHGGGRTSGFAWLAWRAEALEEPSAAGVRLRLTSPDGQAGFPGTLQVAVVYRLTAQNELVMDYTATTDKPTHVNLTNHTYWNLTGDPARDVLGHRLTLWAEQYLPADGAKMPLGPRRSVGGTPMDFRETHTIGSRMAQTDYKVYDHCYVLSKPPGERLALAARVEEPDSGRVMEIFTTQPGVQLYTGNALGLCLETQHFPNSPNEPGYPSTVLRPGQTFRETTVHRFGTR